MAEHLFTRFGMQLNGLVLISSVLDLGSQDFRVLRHDEACLSFLPTYAAIAHYRGKHPACHEELWHSEHSGVSDEEGASGQERSLDEQ